MPSACRVLVVEDFPDVRQTLIGLLAHEGYEVQGAASLQEARARLVSTAFGVAVLDIRLDDTDEDNRDGLILMYEIQRKYPKTAVIILTGYADVDMVRRALEPDETGRAPAFGFLEKNEINRLPEYVSRAVLYQRLLRFWTDRDECKLCVSLEQGNRPHVQLSGKVRLTTTSPNSLHLDRDSLMAWGNETSLNTPSGRRLLKTLGRDLYRLLFEQHSSVLNSYQRALGSVGENQKLQLTFETNRDWIGLPFEFLFSDSAGEYLVLLHPVIRQMRGVVTRYEPISAKMLRKLSSEIKLRFLLLVSNTEPRQDEIDQMGQALVELLSPLKWLHLHYVPTDEATHGDVQDLLNANKFHIVHYIGHGVYRNPSPEASSLFFWRQRGRSGGVMPLSGNDLRFLFENAETRLVHLTCCEGMRMGDASQLVYSDYLGIADSLIQAGVPSVVGFRWPVDTQRAQTMTLAFYSALFEHGSPELALLEARRRLARENKDDLTWLSPVLIVQG